MVSMRLTMMPRKRKPCCWLFIGKSKARPSGPPIRFRLHGYRSPCNKAELRPNANEHLHVKRDIGRLLDGRGRSVSREMRALQASPACRQRARRASAQAMTFRASVRACESRRGWRSMSPGSPAHAETPFSSPGTAIAPAESAKFAMMESVIACPPPSPRPTASAPTGLSRKGLREEIP